MPQNPTVTINVVDNGAAAAIELPQQKVQVVLGCAVGGTPSVPVATSNSATLKSVFVGGPLVQAAGLVTDKGGTVIALGLPIVTKGSATSVVATVPGGSTSAVTVTLDSTNGAWDDTYFIAKCPKGGTIGTGPLQLQISLDAGRNFGPPINLGTANTLAIPETGITLNFGAGALATGDSWQFATTAPAWNDAGVQAALVALGASQYAIAGWGSMHLVGVSGATDVANLESYLDTLLARFVFTRCLTSARDASPSSTSWGGTSESETTWANSLATAFSAASAKRVCVGAGYYNIPSPFPNAYGGTPSYRRSITWAVAARRTQIALQRRAGRVKDGSLVDIVVDPTKDPGDGFIYHDEAVNQSLTVARFLAAITYPKKPGIFAAIESLMSPNGSQFTEIPIGNVVDIACDIAYATGIEEISDDLRLKDDGTLYTADALTLQNEISNDLATDMTNQGMVSDAYAAVDQTHDVAADNTVPISVSVLPKGYVNAIVETVSILRP